MYSDVDIQPYGSWRSPITIETLVSETITLTSPISVNGIIYWLEGRPAEKGRNVIVGYQNLEAKDLFSKEYNARSKVHEYGGGSYLVHENEIYFCEEKDQRIYRIKPQSAARPVTEDSSMRYADMIFDDKRKLIYAVREEANGKEIINTLVKIDPEQLSSGEVIASGADFYSSPSISPNGDYLAYLRWNHPNMPWDGCELMLNEIKRDGLLQDGICVAGGKRESVFQPRFAPDGVLYFISDRSGYWNLYRYNKRKVELVLPMKADFGYPQWVFGLSTYVFVPNNGFYDIIASYTIEGIDYLGHLSLKNFAFTPIKVPYTQIRYVQADDNAAYFLGASPLEPSSIVRMELGSWRMEILKKSRSLSFEEAMISVGQKIEFPTLDGKKAYGFFYPPQHAHTKGPQNERPPLIVRCHGGPTSHATNALNIDTLFWTTRGIAVLDVNYRGSSGHGRQYREAMNGNWGRIDVNDACDGALFLAHQGLVDKDRMVIKGGSAGGYLTLCAAAFRDVFHGAVSYFGISDLEKMVGESEKFESHYHESLIGPYPQLKEIYYERSPIHFVKNIHIPVLLFHGADDKIVVPSQSEEFFQTMKKHNKKTYYFLFEKEGHGFRGAESLRKALQAENIFYSRIFRYTPEGVLQPNILSDE